jgi:sorbitol/mannitol transport system permease protein
LTHSQVASVLTVAGTAQGAAFATVVSAPVVILGWICQRSLVRGLLFVAVK